MSEPATPLFPPAAIEATAADCRAELDAFGLSHARAAREIGRGVSSATLSRWLAGRYDGDVAAVTARVRRWLETRADARARDLAPAGLDRHAALGVTEEIEAALAHAQAAADIVLIHGRSGAGKSWAAARYCARRSAACRLQVRRGDGDAGRAARPGGGSGRRRRPARLGAGRRERDRHGALRPAGAAGRRRGPPPEPAPARRAALRCVTSPAPASR